MTSTTLTPATTAPHRLGHALRHGPGLALRAIRAFGSAAVGVALLGSYGDERAGVRDPRPEYVRAAE
ncbi:hypothetical protein [Streptomyces roseicoloratus]|uniref:Uncharacterized protein n=1 Tax=Streptomyces roseicoloratus TaxID=2508722 RepID=A0ABY9RXX2_9ACTN|nr:hypothetical protein [Streptomyces roseicoloratus]WMX45750.1 hypothetical protein RGF97_14020 [Streptomyces roseicoloratus]